MRCTILGPSTYIDKSVKAPAPGNLRADLGLSPLELVITDIRYKI